MRQSFMTFDSGTTKLIIDNQLLMQTCLIATVLLPIQNQAGDGRHMPNQNTLLVLLPIQNQAGDG
jgi:hypothetical protein